MSQTRRKFIHLGVLCGGVTWAGRRIWAAPESKVSVANPAIYQAAADKIRPLFETKKPPQAGDWLADRKEPGQTFDQYLKTDPNRRTAERSKLYLQPIGEFTEMEVSMVGKLKEFMQMFFGMEVVALEKIGMEKIPSSARRDSPKSGMKQILTTHLLDNILLPNRPKDAVAVLAITPSDLWPGEGWNFVFGQASLAERVGVWSTARFGDPNQDPTGYLRRVLQVAVHETGHMFGIRHCTAYECCMNGSNNLSESDRAPLFFCPECDPKIWWACKLDPAPRAQALAEFAKRHQLEREADRWTRIVGILGG